MSNSASSRPPETDWERVRALTDDEIDTSDIPEVTEEMFARGVSVNRQSVAVTLDVDWVIVAWFKSRGEHWEREMTKALHEYLMAHLDDDAHAEAQVSVEEREAASRVS